MPHTYRFTRTGTVGSDTFTESVNDSAETKEDARPTVAAAKTGTLTTRTDNDTGTLTMTGGHGIITGDTLDVFWTGGSRRGMTVGTVATNSVPIDGGSGDNLPTAATAITAMVPEEVPFTVDGDEVVFLSVKSPAAGYVTFKDDADAIITAAVYQLDAGEGKVWYSASGETNPLAGKITSVAVFSHGSTTAREMIALALSGDV
jgi:hypothetical protein